MSVYNNKDDFIYSILGDKNSKIVFNKKINLKKVSFGSINAVENRENSKDNKKYSIKIEDKDEQSKIEIYFDSLEIKEVVEESVDKKFIDWDSMTEEEIKILLEGAFLRYHRTIVFDYLTHLYRKEPSDIKAGYIVREFLDGNGNFTLNFGIGDGESVKKILGKLPIKKEKKKMIKAISELFQFSLGPNPKGLRKTKSMIGQIEEVNQGKSRNKESDESLFDGIIYCNEDYSNEVVAHFKWIEGKYQDAKNLKEFAEKDMRTFYRGAKKAGFEIPKLG